MLEFFSQTIYIRKTLEKSGFAIYTESCCARA